MSSRTKPVRGLIVWSLIRIWLSMQGTRELGWRSRQAVWSGGGTVVVGGTVHDFACFGFGLSNAVTVRMATGCRYVHLKLDG